LFTKYSSWQAKQSIPSTTVTFHGDCVKMWEEFSRILEAPVREITDGSLYTASQHW
jgi:hypothetical protein